ncbi:MAG: hypothetical protein AB1894_29995, partial [Chloroflexota bacterium]
FPGALSCDGTLNQKKRAFSTAPPVTYLSVQETDFCAKSPTNIANYIDDISEYQLFSFEIKGKF